MKFKLKPALGIILILLVFGSMLPFISPRERVLTLPKENIINYRLTQEQEDYAVRLGRTVLIFEYDAHCEPCLDQVRFLEEIAKQERNQIILQKISQYIANSTRLRAMSYYGEEILRNPNENETWDVLCLLMVNPPLQCRLREI